MATRRGKNGFTLLELMLWMTIFGIMAAVTVVNFRGAARSDAVRQAARVTESALRRAQTMTLTGAATGGNFPPGGYGVRFDPGAPGALVLFADWSGNFNYDAGEELAGGAITLPAPANFSVPGALNAVFSPPEGRVYFNGLASPDTAAITLGAPDAAFTKRVVIFRLSGLVRVE